MDLFPEVLTNNLFVRLLFASFFGALIGIERDYHGRAAGLRTNMLISLGAALLTILSAVIASPDFSYPHNNNIYISDPGRIAAQIVSGIGFLGAGAIVKHGFTIQGLTTAAGIWVSAALGMVAGAGLFEIGLISTAMAMFTLTLLNYTEKFYGRNFYRNLYVVAPLGTDLYDVYDTIKRSKLKVISHDEERNYKKKLLTFRFVIRIHSRENYGLKFSEIVTDIEQSHHNLIKVSWQQR